jgi:hypothetical protein
MVLEVVNVEPLTEPGKPPPRRLLDEVGVPAVRQHLTSRPRVDAEETQPGHDTGKVIQHSVEPVRFDVFQHINAADHISLYGRPVLWEGWVIGSVVNRDTRRLKGALQVLLASTVVGQRLDAVIHD